MKITKYSMKIEKEIMYDNIGNNIKNVSSDGSIIESRISNNKHVARIKQANAV